MLLVYDVETSRFPDGNAFRKSAQMVSYGAQLGDAPIVFGYYTDPDFVTKQQEFLDAATLMVTLNGKFDLGWIARLGCKTSSKCRVWDCQYAEFVLSGQQNSFASMEQLCELYHIVGKQGGLEEWWNQSIETRDIPRGILEEYNVGDISRTRAIYEAQQRDERLTPALRQLILLGGADMLVLAEMEANGILYDTSGSITAGDTALVEINKIKEELNVLVDFEFFNFDSGDHLSCWLYGGTIEQDRYIPVNMVYKSGPRKGQEYTQNKFQETVRKQYDGIFKPLPRTALKKPGFYQTGEPVLLQLPLRTQQQRRAISLLLRLAELSKQVGSFLHALPALIEEMEWKEESGPNGKIHPTYNQCNARTGRLSCSKPNAQQFPEVVDQFWISRYN